MREVPSNPITSFRQQGQQAWHLTTVKVGAVWGDVAMTRSLTVRLAIIFSGLFFLAAISPSGTRPRAHRPVPRPLDAQEHTYSSARGNYTVEFPSPTWRLVDEPDELHQNTEFVYGDRNDGYLRIRKEALDEGLDIKEFARRDQEQKERFRPGYVDGKDDLFRGRLAGRTVSYEYTQAGKPMAGRTYYLQGDSRTVFVLRFTGLRDKLLRIRNQTDLIARSFQLK